MTDHQGREGAPLKTCTCGGDAHVNELVCGLIADELETIRQMLEQVGLSLCSHPVIVQDFTEMLQSIDELAQRNENLARVLRSNTKESAIETISLESLKNRLLDGVTDQMAASAERQGAKDTGDWAPF
jgi:hypothetical protein